MNSEKEEWATTLKKTKEKQEKELEVIRTDAMAEISKLSEELHQGIKALAQEKEAMKVFQIQHDSGVVALEVGGKLFKTTISTLTSRAPNSMLAALFSGRHEVHSNAAGAVFVDRDPTYFSLILNYLRGGHLPASLPKLTLESLIDEADYYQLSALSGLVSNRLSEMEEEDS